MNKVKKWAAIYDDLSILTSDDYTPEQLPVDGVQWIVEQMCDHTRRYIHGVDYYRWTGDSWAGGNLKDLDRWLRTRQTLILIFGLWIPDVQYDSVRKIAERMFK